MVIRYRRICKAIESGKAVHIVPYLFIVGMEDMSAVLVYVDAFNLLRVYVSRDVRSLVNDKDGLVLFGSLVSKDCAVKACTYY